MSTTTTYRCDRCGATDLPYRGYLWSVTYPRSGAEGDLKTDLCPKCYLEFRAWLTTPPSKEKP